MHKIFTKFRVSVWLSPSPICQNAEVTFEASLCGNSFPSPLFFSALIIPSLFRSWNLGRNEGMKAAEAWNTTSKHSTWHAWVAMAKSTAAGAAGEASEATEARQPQLHCHCPELTTKHAPGYENPAKLSQHKSGQKRKHGRGNMDKGKLLHRTYCIMYANTTENKTGKR